MIARFAVYKKQYFHTLSIYLLNSSENICNDMPFPLHQSDSSIMHLKKQLYNFIKVCNAAIGL